MITQLGFNNYKAFKAGEIQFKPITVLLGANSVGKSSIIQLLLLLSQTANDQKNISALKVNGDNVSLGSNINLFRLKDTSTPIVLKFKLGQAFENILRNLLGDLYSLLHIEHINLQRFGYEEISKILTKDSFIVYIAKSEENFNKICDLIDKGYRQYQNISSYFIKNSYKSATENYKGTYLSSYRILKTIQDAIGTYKDNVFCSIGIGHNAANRDKTNILYVEHICIFSKNNSKYKKLIKFNVVKPLSRATIHLSSDILKNIKIYDEELSKHKNQILQDVRANLFSYFNGNFNNRFILNQNQQDCSLPLNLIIDILQQTIKNIEENLNKDNINYVSPLRAYPKRYYFLDRTRATTSLDTLNGNDIAATLKNNEELKRQVNNWLKHFKLQIDVHTLEDVIHKVKVKQDKLQLDITDVGFGISQVLPIIVQGFFTKSKTMTVIEQPEVHLHPKMQADLADLFIDITLPKNKNGERYHNKSLLIETHSEYILKRLRRRIAEKTINYNDVGIYYIERSEGNMSTIREIDISKTGAFEWPKEFYDGELLNDMLDYLKYQAE